MAAYTDQEIEEALGPAHSDPEREAARRHLVDAALAVNRRMAPGARASMVLSSVRNAVDAACGPDDLMQGQVPLPLNSGGCCKDGR